MAADGIKIPTTVKKQIPFLESSGMVIDDVEKAKVVCNSLVILHGCVNHILIVWKFAAIYHCMNKTETITQLPTQRGPQRVCL